MTTEQSHQTWEVVLTDFFSSQLRKTHERLVVLTEAQLLLGGYPQAERQRITIGQEEAPPTDWGSAEAVAVLKLPVISDFDTATTGDEAQCQLELSALGLHRTQLGSVQVICRARKAGGISEIEISSRCGQPVKTWGK